MAINAFVMSDVLAEWMAFDVSRLQLVFVMLMMLLVVVLVAALHY